MNSALKAYIARLLGAPLALAGGWVATQVVSHVNVVGTLGLGKSDIANAVVSSGVFLGTAAVTYLSHHRGLDHTVGKVSGTVMTVAGGIASSLMTADEIPVVGQGSPPLESSTKATGA